MIRYDAWPHRFYAGIDVQARSMLKHVLDKQNEGLDLELLVCAVLVQPYRHRRENHPEAVRSRQGSEEVEKSKGNPPSGGAVHFVLIQEAEGRMRLGGGFLPLAFDSRLLTECERKHHPEAVLEQLHILKIRLIRSVALCVALHLCFRG